MSLLMLNNRYVQMSMNCTLSEHHVKEEHHVVSQFNSTETLHRRLFMSIDGAHKETVQAAGTKHPLTASQATMPILQKQKVFTLN